MAYMNALNNVVLRASIRAKQEQDLDFDFDFESGGGFKEPERWEYFLLQTLQQFSARGCVKYLPAPP